MGKAATLNGRVGDVSLSGSCYDEHSRNTFLFRNAFGARDVAPCLQHGSVFDNQARADGAERVPAEPPAT